MNGNEIVIDEIINNLKDFQQATVEKVVELLNSNNRVLVADEVGLGKTLIAKGVIAKLVEKHNRQKENTPFKVIYVCSNATIALQNLKKLAIGDTEVSDVSSSRLSMQHLKIYEQNKEANKSLIQLISLTPSTSFNVTSTSNGGLADERALIYSFVTRLSFLKNYNKKRLYGFFKLNVGKESWKCKVRYYNSIIKDYKNYREDILRKLQYQLALENNKDIITALKDICSNKTYEENRKIIGRLRYIFASISIEMLNADIVIMDEFQRFKDLINFNVDDKNEMQMLAEKFLSNNETKVLLLSATPYKIYSTMEEVASLEQENHFSEFINVMDFLTSDKDEINDFKDKLTQYSISFHNNESVEEIKDKKDNLENQLSEYICRTERIFALNNDNGIIKSKIDKLDIQKEDIKSYIQLQNIVNIFDISSHAPVEYIKSTPYLLSFMSDYKLKEKLVSKLKNTDLRKEWKNKNSDLLFLDKAKILNYNHNSSGINAKFSYLLNELFKQNEEKLLWVPPSKPYYKPSGVFEGINHFSKTLIFSKWVFVPRMISTLVSYEAERRVVNALPKNYRQRENYSSYFSYNLSKKDLNSFHKNSAYTKFKESSFKEILLYITNDLVSLFNPYNDLNIERTLDDIIQCITNKLNHRRKEYNISNKNTDIFSFLQSIFDENGDKYDNKILKYTALLSIASPTVVAYRTLYKYIDNKNFEQISEYAKSIAEKFLDMFRQKHISAVLETAVSNKDIGINKYNGNRKGQYFFEKLLLYCAQGNLQSVFDEYAHLITGGKKLYTEYEITNFVKTFEESFTLPSATYQIDTINSYLPERKNSFVNMRSHYAVSFLKGTGQQEDIEKRKENLLTSFNSPFRPFVLASTSIAQEGLDFHQYCRKIVHWNLPHNPIDIEQREGRINRYKNLAIRQNIALKYGTNLTLNQDEDIWNIMFQKAYDDFKKYKKKSDLIPYWILPVEKYKQEDIIHIERTIPMYPYSKDRLIYEKLMKILTYYRLTIGQSRQEEFVEYIISSDKYSGIEDLKQLFINLSPYFKQIYK